MPHVIVLKDNPHYLNKYMGKGTKILIFKLFNEFGENLEMQSKLFKNSNLPSLSELRKTYELGNIRSPRRLFQNPNVEFMDELGKLMS